MEVRIYKKNFDDWFRDRTDYFNSDNPVLVLPGLQHFAVYNGRMSTGQLAYFCVPSDEMIRKEGINLPLDLTARLRGDLPLQSAQDVIFRFRKAQLRFILPEYFQRYLRDDPDFQDGSRLICEDTPEMITKCGHIYLKGSSQFPPEGVIITPSVRK